MKQKRGKSVENVSKCILFWLLDVLHTSYVGMYCRQEFISRRFLWGVGGRGGSTGVRWSKRKDSDGFKIVQKTSVDVEWNTIANKEKKQPLCTLHAGLVIPISQEQGYVGRLQHLSSPPLSIRSYPTRIQSETTLSSRAPAVWYTHTHKPSGTRGKAEWTQG